MHRGVASRPPVPYQLIALKESSTHKPRSSDNSSGAERASDKTNSMQERSRTNAIGTLLAQIREENEELYETFLSLKHPASHELRFVWSCFSESENPGCVARTLRVDAWKKLGPDERTRMDQLCFWCSFPQQVAMLERLLRSEGQSRRYSAPTTKCKSRRLASALSHGVHHLVKQHKPFGL